MRFGLLRWNMGTGRDNLTNESIDDGSPNEESSKGKYATQNSDHMFPVIQMKI